ncbi:hypothetical protein Pph01_29120 [Planotetraspora phitsanulokensis]|uniref:Uncharacterized protein n=1 Tax=Planotetraspora phitsanulokensis TaxID=575192 RepID=A0A8J3XEL8_9ACTN|nr:hypothetical protein Pph01_29120 [Planotetraspora phitsanulokensis]
MAGSATVTMLPSRTTMSIPAQSAMRASLRDQADREDPGGEAKAEDMSAAPVRIDDRKDRSR